MEITVKNGQNFVTISLVGRLDLTSSGDLKETVKTQLSAGRTQILLNLSDVSFINSSGLGTLVSILKDVRVAKGRIALCSLAPYVQEIFEITQLAHVFEMFENEQQAQSTWNPRPVAATT